MNRTLFQIGGALLATTMCLWSQNAFSQEVVTKSTVVETPVVRQAPTVVEKHSTTTTTTGPTVIEKRGLSEKEKDLLEKRMENNKEIREKINEAREEEAEDLEDALDD